MDWRALAMGLAFAFMWSSAFTSARIIVVDAAPLHALAVRFAIAGALAVGWAAARGQSLRLTASQWQATVLFGLCQNALYLGLFFVAMRNIEASLASIIASALPLLVALSGALGFAERLSPSGWLGLLAGLVGVVLIMGARLGDGADPVGVVLCCLGAVALTVATLSVREASAGGNVLMIVGLQMWVGAIALGVVAVLFEPARLTLTPSLVLAFSYTVLFPGLAATFVWFQLVNRIGAVRAATFHFLNPVFGVAVAAVLLGEAVGWVDVLGVAIIAAAILVVQRARLPAA